MPDRLILIIIVWFAYRLASAQKEVRVDFRLAKKKDRGKWSPGKRMCGGERHLREERVFSGVTKEKT